MNFFKNLYLGSDAKTVVFEEMSLKPDPIVFPGEAVVSFVAQNLAAIDNFDLHVDIAKKIFGIPIPIPCTDGVGSW